MTVTEYQDRVEAAIRRIELATARDVRQAALVAEIDGIAQSLEAADALQLVVLDREALLARRAALTHELKTGDVGPGDISPMALRQVPIDMITNAVMREARAYADPQAETTIEQVLIAIARRWNGTPRRADRDPQFVGA